MKKILLIFAIFILNSEAKAKVKRHSDGNGEIATVVNTVKTIRNVEKIAKNALPSSAAIAAGQSQTANVDVESLGLDNVDDKKNKQPAPDIADSLTPPQDKASSGVDISGNAQKENNGNTNKIFSKIKNLLTKNKNTSDSKQEISQQQNAENNVVKNPAKTTLKQRLADERRRTHAKREMEKKEAKMIRLNKLREEYLIHLDDEKSNEEFEDGNIKPIERSFGWSDRFISYDLPALPIIERNRAAENVHIPIIINIPEKIDMVFNAIATGNVALFNSAYKYVLNPNIKNKEGDTILTYATILRRYDIMESILSKGADPDLPNVRGHTPLDIAINLTDLKSADILFNMNADPFYVDGFDRTYLMLATVNGFFPMVELLVSKGLDVNAMDKSDRTALGMAYRAHQELIAKFLLKNGAKTWIQKQHNPEQQNLIKELENRWK